MENQEYVINNKFALSTKRGILVPGELITVEDLPNKDRFLLFIEKGKIIKKKDYKPEKRITGQKVDGVNNTNGGILNPDSVIIPEEASKEIDSYIENMKIPANKQDIYNKNILTHEARQKYQDTYTMLFNINARIDSREIQALNASINYLKQIEEKFNYKNVQSGQTLGTFL